MVKTLIAGGADVNADNGAGDTSLSFALQVSMFTRDPKTADPKRRREVAKASLPGKYDDHLRTFPREQVRGSS